MRAKARRQEIIPTINLPRPYASDVGCNSQYDELRYGTPGAVRPAELPSQMLSDLLWSAFSSPFVSSSRAIAVTAKIDGVPHVVDLYVAMAGIIYLYSPHAHQLVPIARGDFCEDALVADKQAVGLIPPVQLIYVGDCREPGRIANLGGEALLDSDLLKVHDGFDAGLIAGRVFQFAAAHGLVTWFHGWDRERLDRALSLGPERRVLFVQAVGRAAGSRCGVSRRGLRNQPATV